MYDNMFCKSNVNCINLGGSQMEIKAYIKTLFYRNKLHEMKSTVLYMRNLRRQCRKGGEKRC